MRFTTRARPKRWISFSARDETVILQGGDQDGFRDLVLVFGALRIQDIEYRVGYFVYRCIMSKTGPKMAVLRVNGV